MDGTSPRQQHILALARQAGSVAVDDLALRFDVTPQTIRKDLNELCDARLLARTHGGAMLCSGVENLTYEARRHMAATEKVVMGKHAARLIPNDCSLFMNIGTTTEAVARELVRTAKVPITLVEHARNYGEHNAVQGEVKEMSYFGSYTVYHLKLASGAMLKVTMTNTQRHRDDTFTWGDQVWAHWSRSAHVVLTQ